MDNIPCASVPDTMVPIDSTVPVEAAPESMSSDNATVILNVGGIKHETYVTTLKRLPGTRLADPETLALHFRPEAGDYFFDRHPLIFATILNYYRTGLLHVPKDMCMAIMQRELEYWGIDEVNMEDCCWLGYSSQKDTEKLLTKFGIDKKSQLETLNSPAKPAKTRLGQFRATVWEGLEDPFSSTPAKIYTVVAILVTLVSIFTFCANTHSAFRKGMTVKDYADLYSVSHKDLKQDWEDHDHQYDFSQYDDAYNDDSYYHDHSSPEASAPVKNHTTTTEPQHDHQTSPQYVDNIPARKKRSAQENNIRFHINQILKLKGLNEKRSKRSVLSTTTPATNTTRNSTARFPINPNFRSLNRGLVITDYVCYAFFTLEFLIRLIFSPSKRHFFTTWVTWLDLACILPYYIEVILDSINSAEKYQESTIDALLALSVFRVFRILRIFRFNTGLRVLAFTLRSSLKDMFVMILFLSTAVLFFGCLVYYADHSSGTFETIPDSAWWAIVTITTVGYGDIAPKTIIGRIIGSICSICGLLVIGLTVPVIVNKFMTFYTFLNANRKNVIKSKILT